METDWYHHWILWAVASIPIWMAVVLWIRIGQERDYQHEGQKMKRDKRQLTIFGKWIDIYFWWKPRYWEVYFNFGRYGSFQIGPLELFWD